MHVLLESELLFSQMLEMSNNLFKDTNYVVMKSLETSFSFSITNFSSLISLFNSTLNTKLTTLLNLYEMTKVISNMGRREYIIVFIICQQLWAYGRQETRESLKGIALGLSE